MKKNLLFLIAFFTTGALSLLAQPIYNEDGIRLYHTPSQEEIEWAKSKGIVTPQLFPIPPPVGELRPIAEFEPAEAVLIRYPFGIPMSLIVEMAKDIKVITIVANSSEQSVVLNQYISNGVNTANCQFLLASTNTYWTRDYGPWFMAVDNGEVAMFDFNYNRPRPLDNQINTHLANNLSINRYASTLQLTGGNYMNDGIKQAASTTLTQTENPGQPLQTLFHEYLGIEQFHFIADCIAPYDNIQHIDCWSKMLAPNKVLVDSVAPGAPNFNKFEAAANYFRSLTSSWGMPMQVVRVFAPGATGSSPRTPYSNSLILNKKVLVPLGGDSYDAAAMQVYEQAMPGYEIIGVPYGANWLNTDALHCRTHEIADRCMLYIKHQPLFAEMENTGVINFNTELYSYCNHTIYSDSVMVYVRVNGGEYSAYNMHYTENNKWEVNICGLQSGVVEYFIFAADQSGRRECHPYIGAPDPHKFILFGETPLIPLLVIDKTSSSVTSEGISVIEDFITITNDCNGELIFEISEIEFPEMLSITPQTGTIQANGSQIVKLSYNFAAVESGEYAGSFKLLSNDPQQPETVISLHAFQILPVLSLDKTTSSVSTNELVVVEDFITVSNLGGATLTFEIADIIFNELLSIAPNEGNVLVGDSQEIKLTYDFRTIAKGEIYSGSFKLLSNDPFNTEIEITLYASIDVRVNESKLSLIYIFPNPAFDKINISYNDTRPTKAGVYNVLGNQLNEFTLKNGLNSVDITQFPSGIYFIKIEERAFKFIKQ